MSTATVFELSDTSKVTLSQQLRARRAVLGWTQRKLGEKAGIHHRTVQAIEREQSAANLDTLDSLATAFGCEAWHLLKPVDI